MPKETDRTRRAALLAECRNLENAYRAELDRLYADESLSDDEYEAASIIAKQNHDAAYWPVYWNAFALQFPKRQKWFADVFAPSFGICESKQLSPKQTAVFESYCIPNEDTWQTGKTYCRFADKLVILSIPRYSNGVGFLTIKQL